MLKNSVHSFHIFVQVHIIEQDLFNFLILGTSRFSPKKFITSTTGKQKVKSAFKNGLFDISPKCTKIGSKGVYNLD